MVCAWLLLQHCMYTNLLRFFFNAIEMGEAVEKKEGEGFSPPT